MKMERYYSPQTKLHQRGDHKQNKKAKKKKLKNIYFPLFLFLFVATAFCYYLASLFACAPLRYVVVVT